MGNQGACGPRRRRIDKPRCVMPGCRRVRQTGRPVFAGLCQKCYTESVGLAVASTLTEPRCPYCEVLLHHVKNDGHVCLYQRCQNEAKVVREGKA